MRKIGPALGACIAAALLFSCKTAPAPEAGGAGARGAGSEAAATDTAGGSEAAGTGKKSMAIMPLKGGNGIKPDILSQLHGELVSTMFKHSGMEIMNRETVEKILKENELDIYANDSSRLRAGEVIHTDYLLFGTITKLGDRYSLQFEIGDTQSGTTRAAYSELCSNEDLENYRGIRLASMNLLQKMGVPLSEEAKTELAGAADKSRIAAQTALSNLAKATTFTEAMRYLYQAQGLDPSLSAEVAALIAERNKAEMSMLSAPEPAPPPDVKPMPKAPNLQKELEPVPPPADTGNIGEDARARQRKYEIDQENERIRRKNEEIRRENEREAERIRKENERAMEAYRQETERKQEAYRQEQARVDAANKQRWVWFLQENEAELVRYLTENPAFELVYTREVKEGEQDYEAKTIGLRFEAALVPREKAEIVYRSVEESVQNIQEQLAATGRAEAWDLGSWPEKSAAGGVSPFGSVERPEMRKITVEAVLLNDKGRVIGRQGFSLPWGWAASFTGRRMTLSALDIEQLGFVSVEFSGVPIDGITDTLTVNIVRINGKNAADSTVSYSGDWAKWESLVKAQNEQRAARRAAAEKEAARKKRQEGFDIFKALLPHQVAAGGMFTNPAIGTVSLYNTVPFLWTDAPYWDLSDEANWFAFDYGCDFSFLVNDIKRSKGLRYYSVYPNIHLRMIIPFLFIMPIASNREGRFIKDEYGAYMGFGFGVMCTAYGSEQVTTPAFDWKIGIKVWRLDIAYSLAFNSDSEDPVFIGGSGLIHKLTLKLLIPY
jgi:hypothetical protein